MNSHLKKKLLKVKDALTEAAARHASAHKTYFYKNKDKADFFVGAWIGYMDALNLIQKEFGYLDRKKK